MENKKRNLSIDRILQINDGVNMALGIEDLPSGVTTVELGLFSERLAPYVKSFNKAKEIERRKTLAEQAKIDRNQSDWNLKHEIMNNEYFERVEQIKEGLNKKKNGEEILCPTFKRDDFMAAEDTIRFGKINNEKNSEVRIKKGQALLPGVFFKLMGDIIV